MPVKKIEEDLITKMQFRLIEIQKMFHNTDKDKKADMIRVWNRINNFAEYWKLEKQNFLSKLKKDLK